MLTMSTSVSPHPASDSVVNPGTCAKKDKPLCDPLAPPPLATVAALPSGLPSSTACVRAGHRDRSMLSLPGGGANDSVEPGALLVAAVEVVFLPVPAPREEKDEAALSVATHLKLLSASRRMDKYRQGGACKTGGV